MSTPVLKLSNGVLILKYGDVTEPLNFSLRDANRTGEKIKERLKEWGADSTAIAQAMSDLTKLYDKHQAAKTTIPMLDKDLSIEHIVCTGEDGVSVEIRADDGIMVSPAALYYKTPDTILIGELILAHATVTELPKRDGQDQTVRDTIEPVLVYSVHKGGEMERTMKPLRFIPSIKIDGRLVSVEKFGRLNAAIPSLMSLEAAAKFLKSDDCDGSDGKKEGVCVCRPISELYNDVVANIRRFVSFSWDERLYALCACWVLATYFFDVFSAFPQLFFYGSQGSGKTRAGLTITYQCRHGYLVTDPTESTLFRMSQALKPTLLIDESLIGPAAWKIARSAFKQGFSVPRINRTEKDGFLMELFSLYMPIATTSTETQQQLGGQEADEARNIRVNMQTGKDPIGRDPELQDFSGIRDELYIFRLLAVDDVVKEFQRMKTSDLQLYGHEREVWLPIFTIASLIGEEVFKTIKTVATDLYELKSLNEHAEEKTAIRAIKDCLDDENKKQQAIDDKDKCLVFTPTQLQYFIKLIVMEEGEYDEAIFPKLWSPERIGALLTKMSLHRKRTGKARKYIVSQAELLNLAERYRLDLSDASDGSDGLKKGVSPPDTPSLNGYSDGDGSKQDTPLKKPSQPSPPSPNTDGSHEPEDPKDFELCANCGGWQGDPKINESAFCTEHHKGVSRGSTCDKWQPRLKGVPQ